MPPSHDPYNPPAGTYHSPWLAPENDSSNPDTLNDVPSGSDPRYRGLSSDSTASTFNNTTEAQRIAELQAEVREQKKQIKELTDAHRSVQGAAVGIDAMQDLVAIKRAQGEISE